MKDLFTAYPHLKTITKYSRTVAKRLFRHYPQWLPYACVGTSGEENYLVVAVPAPVHPRERDLLIITYDDRITIHFDWYHAHFGGSAGQTFDTTFADALQFLNRLLSEAILIALIAGNKQQRIACTRTPEDLITMDPRTIICTRSWRGTFDQNYPSPMLES